MLQREAYECADYLGQKLVGPLAVHVEGVGEGSVDGRTRKLVVQAREELRGSVMKIALSRLSDQNLRPVTAWPDRDKLSASWLQCLPGPEGLGSHGIVIMHFQPCLPRESRSTSGKDDS